MFIVETRNDKYDPKIRFSWKTRRASFFFVPEGLQGQVMFAGFRPPCPSDRVTSLAGRNFVFPPKTSPPASGAVSRPCITVGSLPFL